MKHQLLKIAQQTTKKNTPLTTIGWTPKTKPNGPY